MITNEFRPKTFAQLVGQVLPKKVLQAIVKSPESSPRTLIFEGEYGTGKTSLARIFARALNCETPSKEPCYKCASCLQDLTSSSYYVEYDTAVVGNAETIRSLIDSFYYTLSRGNRVIVFDEIHMASSSAQSALLKVVEECPEKVFFIFATTDAAKVLPTIRSRSLELRFEPIAMEDVIRNLQEISSSRSMEVSDTVLKVIALRSHGHMRNAHMLLEKLSLLGEEAFSASVRSSRASFLRFFLSISRKDKDFAFKALEELSSFPLVDLKIDFHQVLLELTKAMVGVGSVDSVIQEVAKALSGDILKLIKFAGSEWVLSSFNSDIEFQAAFLAIFQQLASTAQQTTSSTASSMVSRAMKVVS